MKLNASLLTIASKLNKKLLLGILFLLMTTTYSTKAEASWSNWITDSLLTPLLPTLSAVGIDKEEAKAILQLGTDVFSTVMGMIGQPWYEIALHVAMKHGGAAIGVLINVLDLTESQGIAAGDNLNKSWRSTAKYSTWGSVMFGNSNQKTTSSQGPGQKHNSVSGIIGADLDINDDLLVGIAISLLKDKAKFKDELLGNRSKSKNVSFSLYSLYDIGNNFYLTGSVGFGVTELKINSLKPNSLGGKSAVYSNQDIKDLTANIAVGYDIKVSEKFIVSPEVGIKFTKLYAKDYREKSSDPLIQAHLATVNAKDSVNIGSIIGLNAQGLLVSNNTFHIIPQAHVKVNTDLHKRSHSINVTYDSLGISFNPKPTNKKITVVNLGVSTAILSSSKTYEITLSFDHFMAKKYSSNQGAVELRINF